MKLIELTAYLHFGVWLLLMAIMLHNVFFALAGLFRKRAFKRSANKGRYGVVIGARNEETVIGDLIRSIRDSGYPQDKLTIFVCAHNCTDRTSEIAENLGAEVVRYDNPAERTVGYAYRYLFSEIISDSRYDDLDGFFIINADNVVPRGYFDRMNDAFMSLGGRGIVTSCRNSRNFGQNVMSCLYGVFFMSSCRLEARGRAALGCSVRVSGTGFVIPASVVKNGWPYVSITEDWELTAAEIGRGTEITYCDDAEFFDEQPTTVPIMARQRLRWARGHLTVFFSRFGELLRGLFRGGDLAAKRRFSCYDAATSLLPGGLIGILASLTELAVLFTARLLGYDAGVIDVFGTLIGAGFGVSYLSAVATTLIVIFCERERIRNVPPLTMAAAVLLWPFFFGLNIVFDMAALFIPGLEWKPIPHGAAARDV